MSEAATLPPPSAEARARDGRGQHDPLGRRERGLSPGADRPARRGDRAAPADPARRRAAPRTAAGPGREGLSVPRRTGQRDRPRRSVRRGTTPCSPISGCTAPSANGPARCAPRSSARSTSPRRTSSSGSPSPSSAARRSRASSPSPASAAGATSNSTRRSATISPATSHALADGDEGAAVLVWRRDGDGCACSGRPRAARRPPIPASTRIWRPIRRRSGTCSTGRPRGAPAGWYPKLEY